MPVITEAKAGGINVLAFLDMLAWSEGTSTISASDDGYNVIVGGELFTDYSDHPRRYVRMPRYGITSSACILLLTVSVVGCGSKSALPATTPQCPPPPAPAAWAMQPPSWSSWTRCLGYPAINDQGSE